MVSVRLSCLGTAYCAAYISPQIPPSCSAVISLHQLVVLDDSQAEGSITLGSLSPASNHSVFCVSVSSSGASTTSYSAMLDMVLSVRTVGAKIITATLQSSAIPSHSLVKNMMELSLNAPPTSPLVITLRLISANAPEDPLLANALFPSTITISTSSSWTKTVSVSVNQLPGGNYSVAVLLGGDEFIARILPSASFRVIPQATESPSPPRVTQVGFTNGGEALLVDFDEFTDLAQLSGAPASNLFACNSLFLFDGMLSSSCEWVHDGRVRVTPREGLPLLGGSFTLLADRLRAQCGLANTAICGSWSTSPSQTMTITAPTSPTLPVVVPTYPPTLGACASFLLGLSASFGSGGRAWSSVNVTAKVFGVADNETENELCSGPLNAFLRDSYRFSPAPAIPRSLLPPDGTVNFHVVLCNFLGGCGEATVAVRVTSQSFPSVLILGGLYRSIVAAEELFVEAVAENVFCPNSTTPNTGGDTAHLEYQWEVFLVLEDQTLELTNLTSISKDPRKLKLSPYSLTVGHTYLTRVSVTNRQTLETASAAVEVFVAEGVPIAIISGASAETLAPNTSMAISSASSSDQNVPTTDHLLCSWSCFQSAPVRSSLCWLTLERTGSSLIVLAPVDSPSLKGVCSTITLQVFDSTANLTRSSDVVSKEVCLVASNALTASILLAGGSVTMNADDKLSLVGLGGAPSSAKGAWSVDDSGVSLADALSPLSQVFTTGGVIQFPLILAPGTLTAKSTSYLVSFALSLGDKTVTASITVNVNSPPSGGQVIVTPLRCVAWVTPVTFSASSFTDPDLPLAYEFSCEVSPESPASILHGRSEVASITSPIPGGQDSLNDTISLMVGVFDSLSASTHFTQEVQAIPSTSQLQSFTRDNSTNADEFHAEIDLHGAALNSISCLDSPDCSSLHRSNCSTTPNTCGSCVEGYVGTNGNDNSECLLVATVSGGWESPPSCHTSLDCGPWSSCIDAKCSQTSQSCPEPSCSGRGDCIFFNSHTGAPLSDCFLGDPNCRAECQCHEGYSGLTCGQTLEELLAELSRTQDLLQSSQDCLQIDDTTRDRVLSWIDTLRSLSHSPYRLSPTSVGLVRNLTVALVDNISSLSEMFHEDLLPLFDILASTALNLTSSTSNASDTAQFFIPWDQVCSTVQGGMEFGQDPIEYLTPSCRVAMRAAGSSSSLLTVPQTELERALNVLSSTVLVEADTTGNLVPGFSVTQSPQAWARTNETCLSDPLRVVVYKDGSPDHHFTAVLQHVVPVVATAVSPPTFDTTCLEGVEGVWEFECVYPNSSATFTISHACDGTSNYLLQTQCPVVTKEPSCMLPDLDPSTGDPLPGDYDCQVTEHNSHNTTCACRFTVEGRSRSRSLATESDDGGSAVTLGVTTKDTIIELPQTKYQMFSSPDAAKDTYPIVVMFGSCWFIALVCLVSIYFKIIPW
jgi:hypothetical protein